ncbi:MAG: hypothetical protein WC979_08090 [Candidatus Pacearchaeota archaeon]|jgi:hypothetical protein
MEKLKGLGKEGKSGKIIALVLTGLLLFILIFSAPAKAYVLNVSADKTEVSRGGDISFNTGISVSSSENSNIQNLVLELVGLNGAKTYSCVFDVNGAILSGCSGMTIIKTSDLGYGYGYSYGYGSSGTLGYKIILDTTDYSTGDYRVKLNASINGNPYSQEGQIITINNKGSSVGTLSGSKHYTSDGTLNDYDKICLNAWKCTEWSACNNGEETRICGQTMADCLLTPKPSEVQRCAITIEQPSNYYNSLRIGSTNIEQKVISENKFAGITESIIVSKGVALSPLIIALVLLIAIMIGLLLGIIMVRSLKRQRKIKQIRRLNRVRYRPLKK